MKNSKTEENGLFDVIILVLLVLMAIVININRNYICIAMPVFATVYSFCDFLRYKRLLSVFFLTGAGTLLIYGILFYFTKNMRLIGFALATIGFLYLLYPLNFVYKIVFCCYEAIDAECVKVNEKRSVTVFTRRCLSDLPAEMTKQPTFSYYYKGEKYTSCNELYSWLGVPEKKDWTTIYINPKKPERYVRPSRDNIVLSTSAGIILLLTGVIICLCTGAV